MYLDLDFEHGYCLHSPVSAVVYTQCTAMDGLMGLQQLQLLDKEKINVSAYNLVIAVGMS